MRALAQANRALERELFRRSIGACLALDALRARRDPNRLQEVQEEIAVGLLQVERRLRVVSARRGPRQARIEYLRETYPAVRESLGPHQEQLALREALLGRERNVLRQIGDAVAWLVLEGQPAVIAPLWAEKRHHHLPEGIGVEAPMQVVRELNSSGRFLAFYNDLTRCIGIGDVTIVPNGRRWISPLSVELKSKWTDATESEAEIDVLSPFSDEPHLAALFEEVRSCLGLKNREGGVLSRRAQRQVDELLERTELVLRTSARAAVKLAPPDATHWSKMRTVLERAYVSGGSFDIPEPGVSYFGCRTQMGEDARASLQGVLDRVLQYQPADSVEYVLSTADLFGRDDHATLVPPIALWPIPGDLRNSLLTGRLFFGVAVSKGVWTAAFANVGVDLHPNESGWTVRRGEQSFWLSGLEKRRLQLGSALAGISPAAVARSVNRSLKGGSAMEDAAPDVGI